MRTPNGPDKKHPGFAGAERQLEARGIPKAEAGAILAAGARKAGAKARKANPRLARVSGVPAKRKRAAKAAAKGKRVAMGRDPARTKRPACPPPSKRSTKP
jgi:hypothetical protein